MPPLPSSSDGGGSLVNAQRCRRRRRRPLCASTRRDALRATRAIARLTADTSDDDAAALAAKCAMTEQPTDCRRQPRANIDEHRRLSVCQRRPRLNNRGLSIVGWPLVVLSLPSPSPARRQRRAARVPTPDGHRPARCVEEAARASPSDLSASSLLDAAAASRRRRSPLYCSNGRPCQHTKVGARAQHDICATSSGCSN